MAWSTTVRGLVVLYMYNIYLMGKRGRSESGREGEREEG